MPNNCCREQAGIVELNQCKWRAAGAMRHPPNRIGGLNRGYSIVPSDGKLEASGAVVADHTIPHFFSTITSDMESIARFACLLVYFQVVVLLPVEIGSTPPSPRSAEPVEGWEQWINYPDPELRQPNLTPASLSTVQADDSTFWAKNSHPISLPADPRNVPDDSSHAGLTLDTAHPQIDALGNTVHSQALFELLDFKPIEEMFKDLESQNFLLGHKDHAKDPATSGAPHIDEGLQPMSHGGRTTPDPAFTPSLAVLQPSIRSSTTTVNTSKRKTPQCNRLPLKQQPKRRSSEGPYEPHPIPLSAQTQVDCRSTSLDPAANLHSGQHQNPPLESYRAPLPNILHSDYVNHRTIPPADLPITLPTHAALAFDATLFRPLLVRTDVVYGDQKKLDDFQNIIKAYPKEVLVIPEEIFMQELEKHDIRRLGARTKIKEPGAQLTRKCALTWKLNEFKRSVNHWNTRWSDNAGIKFPSDIGRKNLYQGFQSAQIPVLNPLYLLFVETICSIVPREPASTTISSDLNSAQKLFESLTEASHTSTTTSSGETENLFNKAAERINAQKDSNTLVSSLDI
ncbi:uncharacterized protein VP01_516g11 [Puccinia sorghi]|uniref:Uncharacterized protein n=1 Tax=Puccinia sorghi TaxID=27349 RepID=A0A0L6UKV4_9BASI|nr:uncharacterized protein VP01_516g11 [Puccinia sorghi]